MYLDPSYQGILTTDAKQQAKLHLAKTWKLLSNLQNHVKVANVENEMTSNDVDENLSDDDMDETNRFETFLRSHSSTPTATTNIPSPPSIETLLEQCDRIPYQSYKLDIMDYWANKKQVMPELYELAKVLIQIPATPV